jgi:hypothetical protein
MFFHTWPKQGYISSGGPKLLFEAYGQQQTPWCRFATWQQAGTPNSKPIIDKINVL